MSTSILSPHVEPFHRTRAIWLAALLAGCGSVPLPSLIALSRIDAQTTDLATLRVAVRLPDAIKPRPGGVNMEIVAKVSGEPDQKTRFLLTETRDKADLSRLADAAPPGFF